MMQSYPLHLGYPVENLDGLWEFAFRENMICREERCPEIRFDDVIPVPSCFDLQLPYRALRGTGFYRKQVNTRAGRIRLTCKGFGFIITAYWDGVRVGESNLTYSEVSFDFESAEGRHELILAVSNVYDSRQAPLLYPYYDFYGYGGLYRSVELHQLPEYSVDRAEVRIVNAEEGRVRVRLRVSGTLPSPLSATFCFDGTQTVEQKLDASPEAEFVLDDKALWSPESPNLHTVRVQVGESVVTERFGLRTVKTEGRKLLLNGREIRLKGICRHESHVLFGVSVPHSLALEDVRLLKDLGCNFVRCVHYPQDSVFLDLCDELGMLVWEESLGWGNRAEQFLIPEFAEAQKEQTRLLTEKSINHPSIIIWGFLNEGRSNAPESQELYRDLAAILRSAEDGRLVSYASMFPDDDHSFALADIISINRYPGWYASDQELVRPLSEIEKEMKRLETMLDERGFGNKPLLISEIGAGAIPGWHDTFRVHWSEEYQSDYVQEACRAILGNPRYLGIAVWHFADCRTYASSYALGRPRSLNNKGVLDEYRRPKLAYGTLRQAFRG